MENLQGTTSGRQSDASRAIILMYHRVANAVCDPWSLAVTPEHFDEQMQVLSRKFYPVSLSSLLRSIERDGIPARSVAITFDDGYADNLMARDILQKHQIPATIFIATGGIDKQSEFWWDELEQIFLQPGQLPQTIAVTTPDGKHSWELQESCLYKEEAFHKFCRWKIFEDPPSTRQAVYKSVWQRLQPLAPTKIESAMNELSAQTNSRRRLRPEMRSLSSTELRNLRIRGLIEIGAHSQTHPYLPALSPLEQEEEISGSKKMLQKILAEPVTSFAFPYGQFTEQTLSIVRNLGFDCSCSTSVNFVNRQTDPYRLPRIHVEDCNGADFERRLTDLFDSPFLNEGQSISSCG